MLADVIAATETPLTKHRLIGDLAALGVEPGQFVMLHVSMRSLGFVVGGAMTLLDAVIDRLGPTGTLMMPAHSTDLSDPASWTNPPVPAAWVDTVREAMPAYDPARTPTWGLGVVPELFRTWPGTRRSDHPAVSLAARGPLAAQLVGTHPLDDPHGDEILQVVITNADDFVRFSLHTVELGVGYIGVLALAMAGAEFGCRRERSRSRGVR